MIRALVLMNIARGKVPAMAKQLAEMDEVVDVYSVTGQYDLVAIIQSAEYERLAESLREGAARAAELIDSGAAMRKLDQLIAESNQIAAAEPR